MIDWRATRFGEVGEPFELLHQDVLASLVQTFKEQPTVNSIIIRDVRLFHLVGSLMSFFRMLADLDTQMERTGTHDPLVPAIDDAAHPQVKCLKCPLYPVTMFASISDNISVQFSRDHQETPGTPQLVIDGINAISHHMDSSPYCHRCRTRTNEEFIHLYNDLVDIETFARKEALFIVSDTRKIRT